ncbi:MAG TPA: polymer-forming cytoskeletal protein [Thermomicrobiaceae bacterium]|nr:polymer-forming cytoskeletal protein [Thermomicrobiaceae bacterium]
MSFFRKDNRTDSFQRQISSLRKQLQGEEEPATDEFRYSEQPPAEEFAGPAAPRDELTYAPSRIHEETGSRAAAPTQSFRPTFQAADANTSVIAANAHWNGTLKSEGSVHIHGKADGELHSNNDVFVAEGAEVDAQLFADNVIVAGVVRGKIEARGRLELLPQGHVAGDVRAPKLIVHEGARLSGQLKMETGNAALTTEPPAPAAPKPRRSSQ